MFLPNPTPCDYEIAVGYPMAGKVEHVWEVQGECVSPIWGVNNDVRRDKGNVIVEVPSRWSVTHVPTGYAIFTELPSKKVALAIATRFEELGWQSEHSDPVEASAELAGSGLPDFKALADGSAAGVIVVAAARVRYRSVVGPRSWTATRGEATPRCPAGPRRRDRPNRRRNAALPRKRRSSTWSRWPGRSAARTRPPSPRSRHGSKAIACGNLAERAPAAHT